MLFSNNQIGLTLAYDYSNIGIVLTYLDIHLLDKYFIRPHHDPCLSSRRIPNCAFLSIDSHISI